MPADPNIIEATEADQPYEPSVEPPKPDRGAILTRVRIIGAQAQGLAGAIEQAAMNPRMRVEFVDAWRRWYGSLLGWSLALERLPFHADDVLPGLKKREEMLQTWRQGFQLEMNPTPAPVQVPAEPEKKPGILSTIPWWVLIPAGVGVAVGGYYGMRWVFRQWFGAADEQVQDVKYVAGVVQNAPAFQSQPQPQQTQQPTPTP